MGEEIYHLCCHTCAFERVRTGDLERIAQYYLGHKEARPDHDVEFAAIGEAPDA